jgi:Ca2+:H+ antiporter
VLVRSDRAILGSAAVLCVVAGLAHYGDWDDVLAFVLSGGAVAVLAALVGRSVDQLGDRFGPGATGVLQSALGNLPELFISIFALRAGLDSVVRAAIVGSILANLLLVLGLAFLVGGLRHGTQQLGSERARTVSVLMLLSVAAMLIPSLAHWVHSPAREHEQAFSTIVSVILIVLFLLSLPASLRREDRGAERPAEPAAEPPRWPVVLAVGMLAAAGALAAFISFDGESTWLEGATLIALYGVIATSFWWG